MKIFLVLLLLIAGCGGSSVIHVTTEPKKIIVPRRAQTDSNIQSSPNWKADNDLATNGSSSGTMQVTQSPSISGSSRQFVTTFSNSGGERYYVWFDTNQTVHNFIYSVSVLLDSSSSNIANLELDLNQVTSNGQTVIYGFQCDGYSGTWDYTKNAGTPTQFVDQWVNSSAHCNPREWSTGVWHNIKISYSRDDSGNVTYGSVWFDGVESKINATVPSSFALGWQSSLITNFQVDGIGSGTNIIYADQMTVEMW